MSKIRRRQRCPKCSSLNIIRWGSREGHQRYKCRDC
ncbi:MAG: IS1595 family transposase, partial [Bacteroidales bacterium]|nr:IS1595 family transposase [Bacteroidales bacterium]